MSQFVSLLKDISATAQSIVTIIAVIIAGLWTYGLFIRNRLSYPRAKIEHNVSVRQVGKGKALLSVEVVISNAGSVLMRLESGEIRISQMLPPQDELLAIIQGDQGISVTNWQNLIPEQLLSWNGEKRPEIEPGENSQLLYHFVVPSDVSTLLLYTYFGNEKKRSKNFGWELTTIHEVQSADNVQVSWLKKWILR